MKLFQLFKSLSVLGLIGYAYANTIITRPVQQIVQTQPRQVVQQQYQPRQVIQQQYQPRQVIQQQYQPRQQQQQYQPRQVVQQQ
jgi:hypothetical protein